MVRPQRSPGAARGLRDRLLARLLPLRVVNGSQRQPGVRRCWSPQTFPTPQACTGQMRFGTTPTAQPLGCGGGWRSERRFGLQARNPSHVAGRPGCAATAEAAASRCEFFFDLGARTDCRGDRFGAPRRCVSQKPVGTTFSVGTETRMTSRPIKPAF